MNPDTVREMKRKGEPIYYGDGTSYDILEKLGLSRAKMLIVAISDPISTRKIVAIARNESQNVYIIVRTRYIKEVEDLINLGANEVIPEEFETSIEIFARVLNGYHVPRNVINEYIEKVRADCYRSLRSVDVPAKKIIDRHRFLKHIETDLFLVKKDSPLVNKPIKDLELRKKTHVTIIAVLRGDEVIQSPNADFILKENDQLLLVGSKTNLSKAVECLSEKMCALV